MANEPRWDGTTKAGRILRTYYYDKNRPRRWDKQLRMAEEAIANAADLFEMDGGDPAWLRRLAQDVRIEQENLLNARGLK